MERDTNKDAKGANCKAEMLDKLIKESFNYRDCENDLILMTGNDYNGYWYVCKGSSNVNYTTELTESRNINDWIDTDYLSSKDNFYDMETFINAVNEYLN